MQCTVNWGRNKITQGRIIWTKTGGRKSIMAAEWYKASRFCVNFSRAPKFWRPLRLPLLIGGIWWWLPLGFLVPDYTLLILSCCPPGVVCFQKETWGSRAYTWLIPGAPRAPRTVPRPDSVLTHRFLLIKMVFPGVKQHGGHSTCHEKDLAWISQASRANFQFQELQAIEGPGKNTTRKQVYPECGTFCRATDPVSAAQGEGRVGCSCWEDIQMSVWTLCRF